MTTNLFALIDGNCFYASCERIFRPDLARSPIVVLSNNDGCVVTRTKEAKALGIKRGIPFFKIKDICEKNNVAVFSSNYELYHSISERMMSSIASLVPRIEPYSIDECFANLSGVQNPTIVGLKIKERVLKWTGIPSCVGIARTKTLAKLANHLAKEYPSLKGVLNWEELTKERQINALKLVSVSDIWGIGAVTAKKLLTLGINSAWDFVNYDSKYLRNIFGVNLARTQKELQGISIFPFEVTKKKRQQILRSRSFGETTTSVSDIISAVATHACEAAKILREEKSLAKRIRVFFHTSPFDLDEPFLGINVEKTLDFPTDDTRIFVANATKLVVENFKKGKKFKKAGFVLEDLRDVDSPEQLDLFSENHMAHSKLMDTIDMLNRKFGKKTIRVASTQLSCDWMMKRDALSPCYTTRIEDILKVY